MIALALGVAFLYQYHAKITFNKTKITKKSTFIKFIATYAISYALNAFLVYVLTQKITYLIAIPIINVVLSTMVYYTYKKIVFIK
jgi:putative flippase GtrA